MRRRRRGRRFDNEYEPAIDPDLKPGWGCLAPLPVAVAVGFLPSLPAWLQVGVVLCSLFVIGTSLVYTATVWYGHRSPAVHQLAASGIRYAVARYRVKEAMTGSFLGAIFYLIFGLRFVTELLAELHGATASARPEFGLPGVLLGAVALAAVLVAQVQRPELASRAHEAGRIGRKKVAKPWHAKFLAHPNARIEVDPRGPGRTRLRIGAPGVLPMPGNARLRPRRRAAGEGVELERMRWVGPGEDAAERWYEHLREGLEAIHDVADEERLRATLSPHGLLVQLPGLVPDRHEFHRLRDAVGLLTDGLATAAAEPPPEGIHFTSEAEVHAGTCACCWEEIAQGEATWTCGDCDALQHADCHEWTGGCGRFACAAGVAD